MEYLEFELPIKELEDQLQKCQVIGDESQVDVSETCKKIQKKLEITKKEKSTCRRKGRRPFKDRGNKKGKRYGDQRRNHNPAAGFGRKRKRKR